MAAWREIGPEDGRGTTSRDIVLVIFVEYALHVAEDECIGVEQQDHRFGAVSQPRLVLLEIVAFVERRPAEHLDGIAIAKRVKFMFRSRIHGVRDKEDSYWNLAIVAADHLNARGRHLDK